jgi:hypothetical protein
VLVAPLVWASFGWASAIQPSSAHVLWRFDRLDGMAPAPLTNLRLQQICEDAKDF